MAQNGPLAQRAGMEERTMHNYRNIITPEQARREALNHLRDNRKLNDAEFAYSPLTCAVGIRWDAEPYRVFNIYYPMYKKSEFVTDWVSVGKGIKAN